MYDLSFIEFSKKKVKERDPFYSDSYFSRVDSMRMSFLTVAPTKEESLAQDVTSLWSEGAYEFESPYFLFFLYEPSDESCLSFLREYGAKLNNLSSSNVTILTFFEKSMVDSWRNVQHREKISAEEHLDSFKVNHTLNVLRERFKVSSLPALILVKKVGESDESIHIPLLSKDPSSMYASFKGVIEKINDNCEEDFAYLSKEILGDDSVIENDAFLRTQNQNFLDFFDDARKEKDLDLYDIVAALGITRKTIYNKKVNRSFDRMQCLKLGFLFGLNENSMNRLLRYNNQRELSYGEFDCKVKEALRKGKSLEEVQGELFE